MATDVTGCPGCTCAFTAKMYIGFITGSDRATSRKSKNSVSNRPAVVIDKALCLCNGFIAAILRQGSQKQTGVGVVPSRWEEKKRGKSQLAESARTSGLRPDGRRAFVMIDRKLRAGAALSVYLCHIFNSWFVGSRHIIIAG